MRKESTESFVISKTPMANCKDKKDKWPEMKRKKAITFIWNFKFTTLHPLASGNEGETWIKYYDEIINIYLQDSNVIKIYIPIKQPLEG